MEPLAVRRRRIMQALDRDHVMASERAAGAMQAFADS